jgi:hypothetical protein
MARDFLAIPVSSVRSELLFLQAGDVMTKKRNRLLEQSSSVVLLLKRCLNQKSVDGRELYGLDDEPAQPGDATESDRDTLALVEGTHEALGEGMDAQQQEQDFDWGSDLSDIE